MSGLEDTYGLRGVETKEDLLQALEAIYDRETGDHGISDEDSDVEIELGNRLIEFLRNRNRFVRCEVCEQEYVPRLNPNGCPYTDQYAHEPEEEEDDE